LARALVEASLFGAKMEFYNRTDRGRKMEAEKSKQPLCPFPAVLFFQSDELHVVVVHIDPLDVLERSVASKNLNACSYPALSSVRAVTRKAVKNM
jgi:hypothetical protein